MAIEIGSYEAKTRLAELLRGGQAGNRYVITLRGQPVAELVRAHHLSAYAPAGQTPRCIALTRGSPLLQWL
jgi:antitoxin (DNA-binding transcriptional repressor) of toxin-antitoxin stability system